MGTRFFWILFVLGLVACRPREDQRPAPPPPAAAGKVQSPGCSQCSKTGPASGPAATLIQSCVESLCPDPEFSAWKQIENIGSRFTSQDSGFEAELAPLVSELTRTEADVGLAETAALRTWLQSSPALRNPDEARVYRLLRARLHLPLFLKKGPDGTMRMNPEADGHENGWTREDRDREFQIALRIFEIAKKPIFFEKDVHDLLLHYNPVQLREKIQKGAAGIALRTRRLSENPRTAFLMNLPGLREMAENPRWQELQKDPESLTDVDLAELKESELFFRVLELIDDKNLEPWLSGPAPDPAVDARQWRVEEKLQAMEVRFRSLERTPNPDIHSMCRLAYANALEVLPREQDLASFPDLRDQLKIKFLDKSRAFLSNEDWERLEEHLSTVSFIAPRSRERQLADLKKNLQKSVRDLQRSREQNAALPQSPHRDIFMALKTTFAAQSSPKNPSQSESICRQFQVSLLPDAASMRFNRVQVGPAVLRYGRQAEGIFFHELGHVLFGQLIRQPARPETESWFSQSLRCLIGNHSELPIEERRSQLQNVTEAQYVSEDWADLVSSQIDDSSQNFVCLFVRQTSAEEYESLNFKNENASDPHSSDLFRLLHLAHLKSKGQLPPSCVAAIQASGIQPGFRNCLGTGH